MIMIELRYERIPKRTEYNGRLKVTSIEKDEDRVVEMELRNTVFAAVPMSQLVTNVHAELQEYPDAGVTMIKEPWEKGDQRPRGQELQEDMRLLIRDNLQEALKMFEPICRTVHVRP